MGGVGKDYRKGDPLRGAAILMLSMEKRGISDKAAQDLLRSTFTDLGVAEKDVRRYVKKNRKSLEKMLELQET